MGSSGSKMTESSTIIKPDSRQTIKNDRVSRLIDPRSPSTGIDRTPIQVGGPVPKTSDGVKGACARPFIDPRSPTVGIARTPARDAMRATVGSLARRLGMLFHGEVEDKAPVPPHRHANVEQEVMVDEELGSSEPLLLTPRVSQNFGSMAEHANLLATPVLPPPSLQSIVGDSSPFVLLEEVALEMEADLTLEEAEEARESPLHKRLSMSLITCHEGAAPSNIYADVHRHDSPSSPVPGLEVDPLGDRTDHSYALQSVKSDPEFPLTQVQRSVPAVALVPTSPEQPLDALQVPSSVVTPEPEVEDCGVLPTATALEPPSVPSQEQLQPCMGIRCPAFDSKSPSQVVFKPQWLGQGFNSTGLRARGVQARGGKGGSSLSARVAVKNITNENKGQSAKVKQKGNGLAEGRSPLQILKETNSPRDQHPQKKLKVSTPDRQRLGQMDRRDLTNVAVNKENR